VRAAQQHGGCLALTAAAEAQQEQCYHTFDLFDSLRLGSSDSWVQRHSSKRALMSVHWLQHHADDMAVVVPPVLRWRTVPLSPLSAAAADSLPLSQAVAISRPLPLPIATLDCC
jgi:hypothetical protein